MLILTVNCCLANFQIQKCILLQCKTWTQLSCIRDQNFCEPRPGLGTVVLHEWCKTTLVHDIRMTILTFGRHYWRLDDIFPPKFRCQCNREEPNQTVFDRKCSYFGVQIIKQNIFKPKCSCRRKSMQEKESVKVILCELKIPPLGSLVMLNNYSSDRIFSPHLTTIKDSYILWVVKMTKRSW